MTQCQDLTVQDVMTSPVTVLSPSMTLAEVCRVFAEEGITGAPTLDHNGRLIGVVSQTDIVRLCLEASGKTDLPPAAHNLLGLRGQAMTSEQLDEELYGQVYDFMSRDPIKVAPDTPLNQVATLMAEKRVHRVIVVNDDRVVGIITSLDLLKHYGE